MNLVDSLRWHHVRSPYNIPNDILVTMTGPQIAEKLLNAMNRKVLRKIYGPVLANGQQQNRYSHETYNLYKEMELTRNLWIVKASVGGSGDEDEG
jgi:hypothetical protein